MTPELVPDTALIDFLLGLHTRMVSQEEGLRADEDIEFLHRFRVAIRKTRALTAQLSPAVLVPDLPRFSRELAYVGRATGVCRDLDVFLEDLREYLEGVKPKHARAVVHTVVILRLSAQADVMSALRTPEYERIRDAWPSALQEARPRAPDSATLGALLRRAMDKRLQRVLREGHDIGPDSPDEDLHDLRKQCKKLRYLFELAKALGRGPDPSEGITELKHFQDVLGRFQDFSAHSLLSEDLARTLERSGARPGAVRAARDMVGMLQRRQAEARASFDERFTRFSSEANRAQYAALIQGTYTLES